MSQLSFAHVPSTGFAGFQAKLASGPWALVDTSPFEPGGDKSLGEAPPLVVVKIRAQRAVAKLMQALEGAGGAKGCDRIWDDCERQLHGLLQVASKSIDPAKRDAAARLGKTLLLGGGTGQTQLRYQEEVDFGRKQVAMSAQGQSAQDIALLGLGPLMVEIAQATEALALAIGHGQSAHTPYRRKVMVTQECASTFGWATDTLQWFIDDVSPGPDKELAKALRSSLDELAARYPSTTATFASEAAPPSA